MDEKELLTRLAAQEDVLYAQMSAAQAEPYRPAFEAVFNRVTAAYTRVYHQYVELLQATADPTVRLEVLKRTVFLRWYHLAEPGWLSGIGMPLAADAATVFDALDQVIAYNQLDAEFGWMLAYYAQEPWDFALEPLEEEGGPRLRMTPFLRMKKAVSRAGGPGYSAVPDYVDPTTVAGRGQLSAYWLSIINR